MCESTPALSFAGCLSHALAAIVTGMSLAVRSVLAMLGGLVTVLAIEGVCYYVSKHGFNASYDRPTTGFLVASLLYSYIACTVGGFVAGDIVHRRSILPGIALAVFLALLGLYNLNKGLGVPGRTTTYVVLLNLIGPLFAVFGGYLWSRARPIRRVR